MLNLMDCVQMKDFSGDRTAWYAQDQIEALRHYLVSDADIIGTGIGGDYQGEYVAILKIGDTYVLWRCSFGSCSGCDGLDGEGAAGGYGYIRATMAEGNTRQFSTLEELKKYLDETQDYGWTYSETMEAAREALSNAEGKE